VSWYLQYQRAEDIIAEHQRIADRIKLARLAEEADGSFLESSGRSPIRRVVGGAVLAVGNATMSVGRAVARLGRALDDAEATPTS
jgi:hypothetical protein